MPAIWEKLVGQLKDKGYKGDKPYAIATSALQKYGYLKKGTRELTKKGQDYKPKKKKKR